MEELPASKPVSREGQYDANYGNFQSKLYEEIRREAFGEDIGQNSWLTADEQDRFLTRLRLSSDQTMLDVACGAGGPALRIAAIAGCSVVGIDVHERAIDTARSLAAERSLQRRAEFFVADAAQTLPFAGETFDAITCIDAINHLPNRPAIIAEWARLLKRGGRILFTDPIIVTGPLTNCEIRIRSSASFYLFVPEHYNEGIVVECGLRLLAIENVTHNMADLAARREVARATRSARLREIEGDVTYESQQEFFHTTACLAREDRLSRFLFVAEK
jgi:2-polyprenyl-3-methyl-5-hydroxy-6-metoxy-1,4-benzoquinol methylase